MAPMTPYEELALTYDGLLECYGDTYAEHKGECAHYGDSWPGAQVQLAHLRDGLRELEHELDTHPDRLSQLVTFLPFYYEHRTPWLTSLANDVPF